MSEDGEHDEDPAAWWDEAYDSDDPAPWDTDEPQPAFVDLAAEGRLDGRVLDIGCGTGMHARWAAERGHSAAGTDVSERGIERARTRADDSDLDATFRVADALDMPDDLGPFDTVLDSGLFHAFETAQREVYADELAGLVSAGGQVWLVGFREGAPEDWGPNPFGRADVRGAFAGVEWTVREMRDVEFETREAAVPGLLAVVERA
ncbi:class I SAM-dependent methyltransferase [Halorussus limi]|uniref:Class I SAM-dependent methyltransferase n=1 Tax=Halorussus limi TaxID=2938695 RepID=A0A8U0HWQ4_9EURY|nr:class I SAM-dependent methyltransferase [Halorussus limi]UPV75510.1 class I SAM-dependent methyltransferase [Halorussus limi]